MSTKTKKEKPVGFKVGMNKAQWDALVEKAQAAASPGWRTPKKGGAPAPDKGLSQADALCPAPEAFAQAFSAALAELREEPGREAYEQHVAELGHIDVYVVLRRS